MVAKCSVLLTFFINTLLVLLLTNSSKLILNSAASNLACLISGLVSPSSHFDIVCLVTPIFSARDSWVRLFFFLRLATFFLNPYIVSPFHKKHNNFNT